MKRAMLRTIFAPRLPPQSVPGKRQIIAAISDRLVIANDGARSIGVAPNEARRTIAAPPAARSTEARP